jgi:restriction system protein
MWLMTKYGFFSIEQHPRDKSQFFVSAQVRDDLAVLKDTVGLSTEVLPLSDAPYRYGMVIDAEGLSRLLARLGQDIDYKHFEEAVRQQPEQQARVEAYRQVSDLLSRVPDSTSYLGDRSDRFSTASVTVEEFQENPDFYRSLFSPAQEEEPSPPQEEESLPYADHSMTLDEEDEAILDQVWANNEDADEDLDLLEDPDAPDQEAEQSPRSKMFNLFMQRASNSEHPMDATSQKQMLLEQLAEKRQLTVWQGFHQLAEYHNGVYECNHVSPYTKGAGDVDAAVFILLQDWSSDEMLKGPICQDSVQFGHATYIGTNKKLKELLARHLGLELSQTYGTNLFPFIKPGKMNASIPQKYMVQAAREFALPQIDIVQPKLVICFGLSTFNAVRSVLGLDKVPTVEAGIASPFTHNGIRVWLQAHTGMLGQNNRNRGGINRVEQDWKQMAGELFGL